MISVVLLIHKLSECVRNYHNVKKSVQSLAMKNTVNFTNLLNIDRQIIYLHRCYENNIDLWNHTLQDVVNNGNSLKKNLKCHFSNFYFKFFSTTRCHITLFFLNTRCAEKRTKVQEKAFTLKLLRYAKAEVIKKKNKSVRRDANI